MTQCQKRTTNGSQCKRKAYTPVGRRDSLDLCWHHEQLRRGSTRVAAPSAKVEAIVAALDLAQNI